MSNRGFRIFGLPIIWAALIGVVVFILWKPIVTLFTGLVKKVKTPEQTAATPVPPAAQDNEISTN
jgi:hypothetical protein